MEKRDKSMWNGVEAMSDAQTEANALADPDSPPSDAMFWADADMQKPYRLAISAVARPNVPSMTIWTATRTRRKSCIMLF